MVMKECHAWHRSDRIHNRITLNKVIEVLNQQTPSNLNRMIRRVRVDRANRNAPGRLLGGNNSTPSGTNQPECLLGRNNPTNVSTPSGTNPSKE